MKVLVVGGAGYVGGAVTDLLQASDHDVRVYDGLLYEESYLKPVDFAYGDVRDPERLAPHLAWADVVVWLAALVGDAACALHPEITTSINQDSVQWLAESFQRRIIFLSTCSVYGAQDDVLDESSPTRPLSVYAVTKLAAESLLADRDAVIFRLGTLFGVGDRYSRIRLDLVVNTLTVRAHRYRKFTVYGGNQFRPLLHVRDAARAIAQCLAIKSRGIYNLHSENVKISELAQRYLPHFPGLEIEHSERQFEDTRNYRVSSDKARAELGFLPRHDVEEGIAQVKALLDQQRLKHLDNPRYTNHGFLSLHRTHLIGEE